MPRSQQRFTTAKIQIKSELTKLELKKVTAVRAAAKIPYKSCFSTLPIILVGGRFLSFAARYAQFNYPIVCRYRKIFVILHLKKAKSQESFFDFIHA